MSKHYLRMNKGGNFAYDYRSGAYKNYKSITSAERNSDVCFPIIVELDTDEMSMTIVEDMEELLDGDIG